jgi:hypothetical protein
MANLTTRQLAELLLGIARAQHAIIEAMENSKVGFKSTHFRPMLESVSRIRSNRPDSLADFPSRLLLQMMGRTGPDSTQVEKDLETLLSAHPPVPAATPAGASAAASGDSQSLDMT